MNQNKTVYEAIMIFNESELNESQLSEKLEEHFDSQFVKRKGYQVIALFSVTKDPYTDDEDALHIQIGHVLGGGKYGTLIDCYKV